MPYRICKTFEIESGQMLSKHQDKCAFTHSHTRKIELILEANKHDNNDIFCYFKIIKQIMSDFLETLDHAMCVNTDDPRYLDFKTFYGNRVVAFEATDPTTEVIAKKIF